MSELSAQQQGLVNELVGAIEAGNIRKVKQIIESTNFRLDQSSYNKISEKVKDLEEANLDQQAKEYKEAVVKHVLGNPPLYPSHYTCALLANRVYENELSNTFTPTEVGLDLEADKKEDLEKVIDDWALVYTVDDTPDSGYYGAIYVNHATKQMVVAHRGTEFDSISSAIKDLNMDMKGIVLDRLTRQHERAYVLTNEAIKYVKGEKVKDGDDCKGYTLTATGHSLGGWLAQLSAFHAYNDFDYKKIRAITFDSPGAIEIMEKLNSQIRSEQFDLNNLDIVEYVSTLNPVNSCNTHIGPVYQVKNDFRSYIPISYTKGAKALGSHPLKNLINNFDRETGRPKEYGLARNWPRIKYEGDSQRGTIKEENKLASKGTLGSAAIEAGTKSLVGTLVEDARLKEAITSVTSSLIGKAIKQASKGLDKHTSIKERSIPEGLPIDIGDALVEFLSGKIDLNEQYFKSHGYLDKKYQIPEGEEPKQEFERKFDAKFDLAKTNSNSHKTDLQENKHHADYYITVLARTSTFLSPLTKEIVTRFKDQFKLTKKGDGYILEPRNTGLWKDIHLAREQAEYIVNNINPEGIEEKAEYITRGEMHSKKLTIGNYIEVGEVEVFTKRQGPWNELDEIFYKCTNKGGLAVIHGVLGTGKSTLAVQYAKNTFKSVVQLTNICDKQSIYQGYLQKLAPASGIQVASSPKDTSEWESLVGRVNAKLNECSDNSVAIIIDNLPDAKVYKEVKHYIDNLRHNGISIIITTQIGNIASKADRVYVTSFSDEDALSYLKDNIEGLKKSDIKGLIELTKDNAQNLPRSLSTIAGFFRDNEGATLEDYKRKYTNAKIDSNLGELEPAYKVLLDDIVHNHPKAWEALQYLQHLAPERIPRDIFNELFGTETFFEEIQGVLQAKSLINTSRHKGNTIIDTLQIVQTNVKQYIKYLEEKESLGGRIIQAEPRLLEIIEDKLSILANDNFLRVEKWPEKIEGAEIYIPQAIQLLPHSKASLTVANIYDSLSNYYESIIIEYGKSLEYLYKALNIKEEILGNEHPEIATLYNNIGSVYQSQGNYEQALGYYNKGLSITEKVLPVKRLNIATSYSNIGSIYHFQEQSEKALEYYYKALNIKGEILSEKHPDIASLYGHIGEVYNLQGQNEKALEYHYKALNIVEETLIENRYDKANLYNSIGIVYLTQAKYEKSLEYFHKALSTIKEIFKEANPTTSDFYDNTSYAYFALGSYDKALEYHFKYLELHRAILPETYPNLSLTYKVPIKCYNRLGLYKEEKEFLRRKEGKSNEEIEARFNLDVLQIELQLNGALLWKGVLPIIYSLAKKGQWHGNYLIKSGLKSYFNDDYLKKQLGKLQSSANLKIAKMLMLKYICMAIVHNNMKHTEMLRYLALEYKDLVIQTAQEHPDYFIEKGIVREFQGLYQSVQEYQAALGKILEEDNSDEEENIMDDVCYPDLSLGGQESSDGESFQDSYEAIINTTAQESSADIEDEELEYNSIEGQQASEENLDDLISLADTYSESGREYFDRRQYEHALHYDHKALDIREEVLGEQHPDIATSYYNIGLVYYSQGKYEKALRYYNKALEIEEEVLGEEHPDTVISYNNIGRVYSSQGRYDEALEYYHKALKIEEEVLGRQYPDTATSYYNIGLVYYSQGKYEKALEYYHKALEIEEEALGRQHPETATSYNKIGYMYGSQGNYEEALEYYHKALDIRKEVLGEQHPDTATSYNKIGYMYGSQGNYEAALEYYHKALNIRKEVLGEQHPDTAASYNNIGSVYSSQSKYEEALEYYHKALKIEEEVLGEEHPDTAISYNNLYITYNWLGLYKEGKEFLRRKEGNSNEEIKFTFDHSVLQIELKLKDTLSTIYSLAKKGKWDKGGLVGLGIKNYFNDDYLKKQLGKLQPSANLKIAKILILKYICMAIVHNNMEHTEVLRSLALEHKELVIQTAQEHPDYFIEKGVVREFQGLYQNDEEYQIALGKILEEDNSDEEEKVMDDSCHSALSHYRDDEEEDGSSGGSGGSSSGHSTSQKAAQSSSSSSNKGGGSSSKGESTKTGETPPSKSAVLAVVSEIESYGALIHDERLKVQLEHYAKTGVVYGTLAPYVEAAEAAHPTLFRANTIQEEAREELQGNAVHITQELVDKIVGSIAERAGITYDEKLAAQAQHFVNTGNIYDTLHAYLYPQRLIEGMQQREAEEQVHEYEHNQTNTTTCTTEVRVPSLEHEAPNYIDLAS